MSFRLQTRGRLLDLHCSVALTEWDLDQELRLQITTDQDVFVKPNLWLMVNPNIVCQSPHGKTRLEYCCVENYITIFCSPIIFNCPQSNRWAPGCSSWPRPPVNYCLLIGLALKYNGSLRVQQIYNFTKELFPFFQTAPDGWKNTIRHNLCFNHSFKKTFTQSRDNKKKSCCWLLTSDGHQRLREELLTLTPETLKQLERSAANPGDATTGDATTGDATTGDNKVTVHHQGRCLLCPMHISLVLV
uniref:Fork-head domain-containing protein n=1 Tax=Periophthalmus magnuspinnatus TaxID=409849 RepID=A0A3B4B5R7_9GOBI